MTGYIYQLRCPVKNEPIYVGRTINPERRKKQHEADIRKSPSALYVYFRGKKLIPEFEIIDSMEVKTCLDNEYCKLEAKWIKKYAEWGYELLNTTDSPVKSKYHKENILVSSQLVEKVKGLIVGEYVSVDHYFETAVKEKIERERDSSYAR